MATPQFAIAFLQLVEKSQLLSPDEVASAVSRHRFSSRVAAKDVAIQFVKDGLLTRYQAERLLKGKYRGFLIGDWKLLEILGSGGMGMVYIARNLQSGKKLALKLLSESRENDAAVRARFELEARAGTRLNHPNIVKTVEYARTGDTEYLVMELVESINMQELIDRDGRIAFAQACDFVRQTAAALEHAHGRGLVHRDVKPANVLICRDGKVKVLDFGLALVETDDESEFALARIFGQDRLGTADFAAPEQALDSFTVDERADIYSLGCTLYNALTGEVPFPYDSVKKKLAAHRKKRARPVLKFAPDVPVELEVAVFRMMSKRSEKRPQSMAEVRTVLKPFAQRGPVEFDFRKLLRRRIEDARKRIAQQKDLGKKKRIESGSWATRSLGSATTGIRSSQELVSDTRDPSAERESPPGQVVIRHRETGNVLQVVEADSLVGADLAHAHWPEAVLAGFDLAGATLMHANLSGADMRRARFVDAVLFAAVLKNADLEEAAMLRADLSDAILSGCNLTHANLSQAKMRSATLMDVVARGADFTSADLSMATVRGDLRDGQLAYADLRGANFAGCDLTGANLEGAKTAGANFRGAIGPDGKHVFSSSLATAS